VANPEIPNFGELLAPYIGQVPEAAVPNFLAMLERGAADRYRGWAEQLPEHREGLLACAGREDEIANVADQLFPIGEEIREEISAPLPGARDTYYAVFADLDVMDQLAIQADAELQGAAAWRGMISEETPAELRAGLESLAQLEETSSAYLRELLAR
jgi:hypothetical protein